MSEPDAEFGCFCLPPFEPVAGAPSGALSGLTFAVKDLIDTRGTVTGAGNPDWRRTHPPARAHAHAVQALLDAGARLVARTIADELAFSLEGENHFEGTPINPRCPDRLPGGSSSGSAVAVAAGLVDFALGTDTGGSVRVPAAFCGIFGMRPTHGAIPLAGVVPFAASLDTVGWFARDASTLGRVGEALLAGDCQRVHTLTVASDAFALADRDVADALHECLRRLPYSIGAADAAPVPMPEIGRCYQVVQAADILAAHGDWLRQARPAFGPKIAPRFKSIFDHTTHDVYAAALLRDRLREHVTGLLARSPGSVLVVPSAPCVALARGLPEESLNSFYQRALAIGGLASLAGLPQISIPISAPDRLPVGLGIIGPPGADHTLLGLAATIEVELGRIARDERSPIPVFEA
jgi:amidase